MTKEVKDLVGLVFTRLTVVSRIGKRAKWNCVCECGKLVEAYTCQLETGNNSSCGCLKRDITTARNTTHSMSKYPEYSNWKDMNKRCFNPNNKRFKNYSEKGISVHPDFIESFPKWLEEIGRKPEGDTRWSVGRIDNNGWYTYGNMRWETDAQQARNHSLQSNNTSGVSGVKLVNKVIKGVTYQSWEAGWNSLEGKRKTTSFSISKYGDLAKQMAIDFRVKKIEELNEQGADYAQSHGK